MTRTPLPLYIEDISEFAAQLRKSWPQPPPGQSETLSLIAKAARYRNHQHLRADATIHAPLDKPAEKRVLDALRCFDASATMIRWPQKTSVQRLCVAWFWSRLPTRREMSEREVNAALQQGETFGDHVLLRRSLIDHRLVTRAQDGSDYRRVERRPDAEELRLIRALSERVLSVA